MPGKGYSTIGLKPNVLSMLQNLTDMFYPGMFLPSTLIILMHEVRLERYSVEMRRMRIDLSGRYHTLTIRSDVKEWLKENHEGLADDYKKNYSVKCFSNFVSYFLANLLESKIDSQRNVIRLKESDFSWLQEEYDQRRKSAAAGADVGSFERFADSYINDLLRKMREARAILAV